MSSSSSSLFVGRELDVFLSFSDEIHLGNDFVYYLSQNGIKTFKSDSWKEKNMRPVDQRTLETLTETKVAVVMTTEEQPVSAGFLEELLEILEFQEKRSLTVIPIFLTNPPLNIEEVSQLFPERAQIWRSAVAKLDNIAAKYSLSGGPNELNQIMKIADDILVMFLSSASSEFDSLVGMDRQMKAFHELLALDSVKEVRTIGIWGKSGVGKTTLARYTFGEISVNFQTHVFLDDVENKRDRLLSKTTEGENLVSLDHEGHEITEAHLESLLIAEGSKGEDLISLDHEGHEITEASRTHLESLSIAEGSKGEDLISLDYEEDEITQARRKHRKTLLIADNVDYIEQGKWVAEYANWFAPGSRVILISQNKDLLVDAGVKYMYEVRSLRYDESLQLFSHFAFKQPYPPSDFERLAVRAIQLAGFLPLTLRLFGSFLNGTDQNEWEAALLKINPKHGKDLWKLMEAPEDENTKLQRRSCMSVMKSSYCWSVSTRW